MWNESDKKTIQELLDSGIELSYFGFVELSYNSVYYVLEIDGEIIFEEENPDKCIELFLEHLT